LWPGEEKQILPLCERMTTKKQQQQLRGKGNNNRKKTKCGGLSTTRWAKMPSIDSVEMTIF